MNKRVDHFSVGVLGIILKDDKVLLVKSNYGHFRWQLPGGYVEKDELLSQALHREIKEELGVEIDIKRLNGIYVKEYDQNITFVFLLEVKSLDFVIQREELSQVNFFSAHNLPKEFSHRSKQMIDDFFNGVPLSVVSYQTIDHKGIRFA